MRAPKWLTATGTRGCVWTLRGVRIGRTWTLGRHSGARPGSTEVPQTQFIDFVVVEAELEYIIMRQTTEAFGGLSFPGFARVFRTSWKNGALFLYDLVSGSFFLCLWVLHVDYETLDSSRDYSVRGAMLCLTVDTGHATVLGFGRISHTFHVAVDSNPGVFGLHSYAEWSSVLSRSFSFSPGCAARNRKSGDSFANLMWLEVVMMKGELITQVMSSMTDVASPMLCGHTHPSSSL